MQKYLIKGRFIEKGYNSNLGELSNIDLIKICKEYKLNVQGIHCKDRIPENVEGWNIINMDNHTGQGTHWICFYKNNDSNDNIFWDSFGVVPPVEIDDLLHPYTYNHKDVQYLDSSSCGWWCIFCIWFCSKYNNKTEGLKAFLCMFSNNRLNNEIQLGNFFMYNNIYDI